MAKTASKQVAKPAKPVKTTAKPAAPRKAAAPKAPKAAPAEPAGDRYIIITGKGTTPIYGNGEMRRVERGKPISVSEAELNFIERSSLTFKRA